MSRLTTSSGVCSAAGRQPVAVAQGAPAPIGRVEARLRGSRQPFLRTGAADRPGRQNARVRANTGTAVLFRGSSRAASVGFSSSEIAYGDALGRLWSRRVAVAGGPGRSPSHALYHLGE